jgi:hypothetical protein
MRTGGNGMSLVKGGRPFYGEAIGILLNKTRAPLLPGNVGNASTYGFPVRIKNLEDFPCDWWCDAEGPSPRRLEQFIQAAKQIEAEGVRAITTGCGFYAVFQEEASQALGVPLFTSPLLLVPLVSRMIGRNKRVGILTAGGDRLKGPFLKNAGIDESIPIAVKGMEKMAEFPQIYNFERKLTTDTDILEREVVQVARELVDENSDVGAIVLECSDMPPFAAAVQEAVNLPIFDFITFINMVYMAVVKRRYDGFM